MGDKSENWDLRLDWLHAVVGELWTQRGLFPGMPAVLGHLGAPKTISSFKAKAEAGRELEAKEAIFSYLDGRTSNASELALSEPEGKAVQRRWALLEDADRDLLRDSMIRFEVSKDQITKIVDPKRAAYGMDVSVAEIHDNPYVLAEQFVGENADDTISFTKIDHGMLPAPDLGARLSRRPTTGGACERCVSSASRPRSQTSSSRRANSSTT